MLEEILNYMWRIASHQAMWFAILFCVFTPLALLIPAVREQKIIRSEYKTDLVYWATVPFLYSPLSAFIIALALTLLYGGDMGVIEQVMTHGREPLNQLPLWVQIIAIRVIADVIDYWVHRRLHETSGWKWHAIHHMPEEIDWMSAIRFHPVNILLQLLTSGLVTALLGFDPHAFLFLAPFMILYSGMVHANLSWDFGPLRYVFASPRFHRWHHTSPELGGDKNFASVFSFVDVIFGTFYMPKDDRPENHPFGVSDPIPKDSFIKQVIWPFKQ